MEKGAVLVCCFVVIIFLTAFGCVEGRNGGCIPCSQIIRSCSMSNSELPDITPDQVSGRPGKSGTKGEMGAIGPIGPVGPPGPKCEVGYERIEARMVAKVKVMVTNCRLLYGGACFFIVGDAGSQYSKADLQRKCEERNANLANVYTEDHRLKLNQFVRGETTPYVEVTLGMTYNPQTNTFHKASGEVMQAELGWHRNYPNSNNGYQMLFLAVRQDASHLDQGIYNWGPVTRSFGLCEYHV